MARTGRQHCEGRGSDGMPCISLAMWRLDFPAEPFRVYFCSSCKVAAIGPGNALWDEQRSQVVCEALLSAEGYETEPGHEWARDRYKRLFASRILPTFPTQLKFF